LTVWQLRKPQPEQRTPVAAPTGDGSASAPASAASVATEKDARRADWMVDLKVRIHHMLIERINLSALEKLPREQIASETSQIVSELLEEDQVVLNRTERTALIDDVLDELLGLGPLEPLLKDPTITDILVNGYNTVFVERRGLLEKVATRFQDERHLLRIIQKIVAAVGRRVDESSPFVDARLADGSRVNAIVAPLAIDGSLLSIRKDPDQPRAHDRTWVDPRQSGAGLCRDCRGASQHHNLRGHRLGQDDAAQRLVLVHR
jgi:pilus assembly protein CpaF